LAPVVPVIWPMVNERPSATAVESGMRTILLAWEAVHTPHTWHATVDKTWSVVYKGYGQGSDLSVDMCASYELDGDARHGTRFYPGSATVRAQYLLPVSGFYCYV
jgi:hypothetical protein